MCVCVIFLFCDFGGSSVDGLGGGGEIKVKILSTKLVYKN